MMNKYVVMILPDPELQQYLNDMHEEGYRIKEMFRNNPTSGDVGNTTIIFEFIEVES